LAQHADPEMQLKMRPSGPPTTHDFALSCASADCRK
jgi:hypothetical protein